MEKGGYEQVFTMQLHSSGREIWRDFELFTSFSRKIIQFAGIFFAEYLTLDVFAM
jgi:hypothetical protein